MLSPPIFVNAATLDSYVHCPHWIWINLDASHVLTASLSRITRPKGRKEVDILDNHCIRLDVSKDDESPLAYINKLRIPRAAFSTFVIYRSSFAFQAYGSGMV